MGKKQGIDLGREQVAQKLLQKGMSHERISEMTGLSEEAITNKRGITKL
ncbi:hypothetical protein NIE88_04400 [Sporolactobacillus shoreicorticis]|uniref:Resolvase HTH domain-containing protein n=1 Tax=Sporolactobacillus shoreicorticis TaxID=1923877 RepID=A0ABW5S025_9BACL|nr:hypothetical protein [Sporolactobacillus shoreicorticis]MCO7125014.1 hypothetical protein [Sporolactobacillus shoreicorticis]